MRNYFFIPIEELLENKNINLELKNIFIFNSSFKKIFKY